MSRFLDERGRIFGKVNIVDILVLLVIVAVVVFAVVRLTGGGSTAYPVTVIFHAEGLRNADAGNLQKDWTIGTTLTNDSAVILGKVQSVVVVSTPEEFPDSTGAPHGADSLIFKDVIVTILGSGQATTRSAHINGVSVFSNDKVVLIGAKYSKPMVVVKTERVP